MHSYFASRVARCYVTVSANSSVLSNSTDAMERKRGILRSAAILVRGNRHAAGLYKSMANDSECGAKFVPVTESLL